MRATKLQEIVLELEVGDVMTRDVISLPPDAPMSDVRELLRAHRISGLPVVDDGRLVGIVSIEDFIRFLSDREEDCAVREKMTREIETVFEDEPLALAVKRFERSGRGRFPVLDRESGGLVGIVTKGDVIAGMLARLQSEVQDEELQRGSSSDVFRDIEADATTLDFRYRVAGGDFKGAGDASSRLKRTLRRLGLVPEVVRRVAIASYEAEMNLVIFTEGGTIGARVRPGEILLDVDDAGPGIGDLEKALEPGFSTAPDWVRELGFGAGMGLPNMRKMSDAFEIASEVGKGTHLRLAFATGEGKDEAD